MVPGWMDALVMTGVFLSVAAGGLIWVFFFHKTRRRRKHHHHHYSHPPHDFLSQEGSRLPGSREEKSSGPQPPKSQP
jgi:hypothetical protein